MSALFARHLDLSPLRGRSRGVVRCVFHNDSSPSLSLDLERQLFHCFSCDAKGGARRFAELVGEKIPSARRMRPESWLQEARRSAAQQAKRQGERAAAWAPWMAGADRVRRLMRIVDRLRASVSTLGPDHPGTWQILALAAQRECEALAVEAELDGILARGRMA